ncbi:MAG: FtsQ-type POTRA domain-containing protein [Candidatus Paceibacterota bacterium]
MTARRRHLKPYQRRRRRRITLAVVLVVLLGGGFAVSAYVAQHSALTVRTVTVRGAAATPTSEIQQIAERHLSETYHWIYPKRNTLFIPKSAIRHDLQETFPRINGISISRSGLTGITIAISERQAYGMWCRDTGGDSSGESELRPDRSASCYFLDENGYVYAPAATFSDEVYLTFYGSPRKASEVSRTHLLSTEEGTSTQAADEVRLAQSTSSDRFIEHPIGNTYLGERFALLRDFLVQLEHLGLAPRSARAELSDDFHIELEDGGYLMVTLKEDGARLAQTLENLRLLLDTNDLHLQKKEAGRNPFEYIDMRFGNRVFYKPLEDPVSDSPQ